MRRLTLTTLMAVTLILIMAAVASGDDYVEAEVLVKCITTITILDQGPPPITNDEELNAVIEELGVYEIPEIYDFLPTEPVDDANGKWDWEDWQDIMDEERLDTFYTFKYSTDRDPVAAAEMLAACNIVELAEPNYIRELEGSRGPVTKDFIPNDPNFWRQWNLHNTGHNPPGGTPDCDIYAPEGWNYWPPSFRKPVVAVLDTGRDYLHPDLNLNFVSGININDPIDYPYDYDGHGTFVTGIIAADTHNSVGIAGAGYNWVKVMPVKHNLDDGSNSRAIVWAVKNGADVENLSWGGYEYSYQLHAAVRFAYKLGVVLCAAKGNDARRNWGPGTWHYPSDYKEVIAVTATDYNDGIWFSRPGEGGGSNWGPDTEFCAPGEFIYSTWIAPDNYKYKTGTSAAAPHISAAAALIQAHYPYVIDPPMDRTASARYILKNSVDDLGDDDWDEYYGWGRLNLDKLMDQITYDNVAGPLGPYAASPPAEDADVKAQAEASSTFPAAFCIYQNYPNPAKVITTFKFDLPARVGGTRVTLEVYDLSGRRVATVLDENLAPGRYERRWDCSSESGQKLPAGVYVYRLRAGANVATRKVVVAPK